MSTLANTTTTSSVNHPMYLSTHISLSLASDSRAVERPDRHQARVGHWRAVAAGAVCAERRGGAAGGGVGAISAARYAAGDLFRRLRFSLLFFFTLSSLLICLFFFFFFVFICHDALAYRMSRSHPHISFPSQRFQSPLLFTPLTRSTHTHMCFHSIAANNPLTHAPHSAHTLTYTHLALIRFLTLTLRLLLLLLLLLLPTHTPAGTRGVSVAPRASRFGRIAGYHHSAHEQTCIIVQVRV
jgi:hypothetical protein